MASRKSWSEQITVMLTEGRRNSAAKIMNRLRSGSLPGWAGGGPLFPSAPPKAFDAPDPGITFKAKPPQRKLHRQAHVSEEDEVDEEDELTTDHEEETFASSNGTTVVKMKEKTRVHDPELWREQGNANVGNIISALYAKLLVVMGIAFPMSEVISTYIPPSYYDAFYLYLYFVSILFMGWMFSQMFNFKGTLKRQQLQNTIAKGIPDEKLPDLTRNRNRNISTASSDMDYYSSDDDKHVYGVTTVAVRNNLKNGLCIHRANGVVPKNARFCTLCADSDTAGSPMLQHSGAQIVTSLPSTKATRTNFGSFYLRIGAVAFGIGSVIYSALEFGQYFELKNDSKCYNLIVALTPAVRMVFTFMQMYFIFLNSRMAISKVSLLKQFGLMHMIGTNLAVWLNVLVQETKHEIVHFYHPANGTIINGHWHGSNDNGHGGKINLSSKLNYTSSNSTTETDSMTPSHHHIKKRGLSGPYNMYECRRANIMGSLVDNASPFLFPCTIEYSLICAAVCYVMWKDMGLRRIEKISLKRCPTAESVLRGHDRRRKRAPGNNRSPHHYTVDCAGSNKGLFGGIFLLVFTIMSLILNFVLIKHPEYVELANLEVSITEIILYSTSTVAVLLGMCQMRQLRYEPGKNLELDNILLIVAQSGSFLFNIFCIIGEHLAIQHFDPLSLAIPLVCLLQIVLQTLFILDASKRVAITKEQVRRKPGREVITFLLVCNLAMWLINALEKSKSDSHPHQLHFYGVWAWTIITDFSMPLAIFYRFHSTVCLCEIWKKAHKIKSNSI